MSVASSPDEVAEPKHKDGDTSELDATNFELAAVDGESRIRLAYTSARLAV